MTDIHDNPNSYREDPTASAEPVPAAAPPEPEASHRPPTALPAPPTPTLPPMPVPPAPAAGSPTPPAAHEGYRPAPQPPIYQPRPAALPPARPYAPPSAAQPYGTPTAYPYYQTPAPIPAAPQPPAQPAAQSAYPGQPDHLARPAAMSQFAALSQPGAQQQPGVPHQPGVPLQPGLMAQPGVRQQPPDPGQPPAPAGPTSTRAKRRGRTPLLIGVTALVAAVIATAGAAIVLKDNTGGGTVRDGSGTYAELSSGKSGAVAAPVDAGSGSAVDWSKVATAVQPAVVAIQVSAQYSGAEGSGVIVNAKEGYVVTNNHVVSGAEEIQATLSDGRIYKAQTIGTDPSTDLAVIQLTSPPGDLKEARLGDSTKVVVGEPVMAVGNPLGYDNTVTQGIVSALNRPVTTAISGEADTAVTNVIQIDAAINPGNSGGPLFNAKGEVIGLNSSIATLQSSPTETAGSIGVAFAIPVNLVKDISAQLIDQGKAQHAYLGVELGPATVTVDGVTRHGVEILAVRSGTPAASSGLKVNDVITAIDGNPTRESESLMAWVRSYSPGQEITLNVVRGDEALDIELALGVYDDAAAQDPSQQNPSQQDPNQQDPSQQDPNQQDPYSELSPDQLPPGWEEFFGTEDPWGGR